MGRFMDVPMDVSRARTKGRDMIQRYLLLAKFSCRKKVERFHLLLDVSFGCSTVALGSCSFARWLRKGTCTYMYCSREVLITFEKSCSLKDRREHARLSPINDVASFVMTRVA